MNRRAVLRACVAGFGAGLVLIATMLTLRLWLNAPSFPERIDDLALRLIPRPLFSAALGRFGSSAKPLLFIGVVTVQLLAATVSGLLFGWAATVLAAYLDLTSPVLGAALGLAFGLGIDLLLLPALGAGSPVANPGGHAIAPALALAALPGLTYGLALALLLRLASPPRLSRDPLTGDLIVLSGRFTRRAAVSLLLPTLGGLVSLWSLRRLLGRISAPLPGGVAQVPPPSTPPTIPANQVSPTVAPPTIASTTAPPTATAVTPTQPASPTPGATLAPSPPAGSACAYAHRSSDSSNLRPVSNSYRSAPANRYPDTRRSAIPAGVAPQVTPNGLFYIVAKDFFPPEIDSQSWHLTIAGLVGQPQTLRYTDLLALPAVSLAATLECISNETGGSLISNAVWTGVPLGTLLAGAAVRPGATHVIFTCADNYTEILPLDHALDPATILVHTMNGAPLPVQHGFPARLYTAGRYGMKNPKWVVRIDLVSAPIRGYWTERGWAPDTPIATFTRIDTPTPLQPVAPGPVRVGGVAFAGTGASRASN